MTIQHVHKYRRVDIGKELPHWVMQCSLPGCSYYTAMRSKKSAPTLIGKQAICNSCGDRFLLNRRALRLAKPTCDSCVKSPKEQELKKANEFFRKLEGEIIDDAG